MSKTAVKPGVTHEAWLYVFLVWVAVTAVVYVAGPLGAPGTLLGMAGLYVAFRGGRAVWGALTTRSGEVATVGELPGTTGAAAVRGRAEPADEPLTSPMTGTECVAYRTTVHQAEPSGGDGDAGGESTAYLGDGFAPFVVDDGTGTAYADPDGAEVLLESGDEVTVAGGEDPPEQVRAFVERETGLDPVSGRRRRYEEVRIDVGQEVYVAGQVDPDGGDAMVALTDGPDATRFYVADDPDRNLTRRLLGEALTAFLLSAILLAVTYYAFWP